MLFFHISTVKNTGDRHHHHHHNHHNHHHHNHHHHYYYHYHYIIIIISLFLQQTIISLSTGIARNFFPQGWNARRQRACEWLK